MTDDIGHKIPFFGDCLGSYQFTRNHPLKLLHSCFADTSRERKEGECS